MADDGFSGDYSMKVIEPEKEEESDEADLEEEEDDEEEEEEEGEGEEEEDDDEWETDDDDEDELWASKRSFPNAEGAIPENVLRNLPNSTIRKIITHVKKQILLLETENYLYEKTIEKLEASEKEIESKIPQLNTEEFEEYMKKTRVMICSSDSETEPEDEEDSGEYEPVRAIDEIRMSQDSFFDNMSDNSKQQAYNFFQTVGDMAPPNYDVMRDKYGEYVGTAAEKIDFGGEPETKSRLDPKILNDRIQLDVKLSTAAATALKTVEKNSLDGTASQTPGTGRVGGSIAAEDDALADFNLSDAKRLSITDRLRFAQEEEEEFRKRFYQHETQALKDESAIQIHIDAHKHALGILMGIREDFRRITNGASGTGMSGKIMADILVKCRRKMRNQLSAEETRARITIRKVMVQKKRTLQQLKANKVAGRSISHIDFEYLLCESLQLETDINEMNNTLQHLKDLTAQFHLVLHDEKKKLSKMEGEEVKMRQELKRHQDLLHHFHETYNRYRQQINAANLRMDEIQKKLSEMQVPQPLDYILMKAQHANLERDVRNLERKVESNVVAINLRKRQNKRLKCPPGTRTVEEENRIWLQDIKNQVNGTADFKEEEEAAEMEDVLSVIEEEIHRHTQHGHLHYSPSVRISEAEPDQSHLSHHLERQSHTSEQAARRSSHARTRLKSAHDILLAPRRFDSRKTQQRKSMHAVYDLDFNIDLDQEEGIADVDKMLEEEEAGV